MQRLTTLALHFSAFAVSLASLGCTKGAGLVESFGSYRPQDGGAGSDGGDDKADSGDDGGPTGPVDGGGAEDPGTDGGPGPIGDGDCCVGHENPSCSDPAIAQCVCAQDPFCCDSVWDDLCASLVVDNGCGVCEPGGGDGATGGPADDGGDDAQTDGGVGESDGGVAETGGGEAGGGEAGGDAVDCCVAHPGTGCGDAAIEACVCGQDDYCCATEWDDVCVGEVDSFGCGACGGGGGTDGGGGSDGGGTDGGGGVGDCCVAHAEAGCSDATVEACVCGQDDYCCATKWDDVCVAEVDSLGCGICGGGATDGGGTDGGGGASDCCTAHAEPGCTDVDVEACVCGQDDYCCATEWNDICAGEVESLGCGSCA